MQENKVPESKFMQSIYEVLEKQKSSPYIKENKTEREIINEILKMRP